MGEWRLGLLLLFFVAATTLVVVVHPFPFPNPQEVDAGGEKVETPRQDADEPADPHIALLESLGSKLNADSLTEDPLLMQKLDRINDISKYTDPRDNTTVIFERNVLDANKAVVVLRATDDKRQTNNTNKRTYIVLIRAPPVPEVKLAHYYMIFAYIRDAAPGEDPKEIEKVGDKKVSVEWDIWDDRVPNPAFHPGWPSCHYTILFSCQVNETAIEAEVKKITANDRTGSTTPSPNGVATTPQPAAPVTAVASAPVQIDHIKTDGGVDPNEYLDLFGDYDVVPGDGKAGRSFGGAPAAPPCKAGSFSFFGSAGCGGKTAGDLMTKKEGQQAFFSSSASTTTTKKTKKIKTTSATAFIPGFATGAAPPGGPGAKPISNADAVMGMYYKGLAGTPPIFISDANQGVDSQFVPDKASYTVHGKFVPGTGGVQDTFQPDKPAEVANIVGVPGTIIPDGMTTASIAGGIHGSLTADSFRPETPGTAMWFNPDGPEAKGVWTPYKKTAATTRPKTTASGEMITYGTLFMGVAGSSDIFIPDGQTVPGFFVANDPKQPEIKIMPHGSFVATKPAGHGTFYAENPVEVQDIKQIRGAFMPDGMNLTGAIAGQMTREGNGFPFVVDIMGTEHEYVKSKASPSMWTPFLKPGEWVPPQKPATPTPGAAPAAGGGGMGTPAAGGAPAPAGPPKKKINQAFMFGVKFPSMGSSDVFIPDDYPVDGTIIPEDAEKYPKPIPGQLIGQGKKPDIIVFRPKDPQEIAGMQSMPCMFVPDGIAPGNGVMGSIVVDAGNPGNASYIVEPPGKGYWYMKGKPENAAVWTPFVPPVLPPQPTLVEKMASKPMVQGSYVPAMEGTEPVFIPDDGAVGCFKPDNGGPSSCGTYYPEKPGVPAEFVEDTPGTLPAGTAGAFVPTLASGTPAPKKFHATFSGPGAPGVPASFKPDATPYVGWTQTDVKVQTEMKRTVPLNVSAGEKLHPSTIPVEVGGGFNGYPTNNHGFDALVNPQHPVFKEYLQFKARIDKSIDTNERVVIVQSMEQAPNITGVTYVSLKEYKQYLEDRYIVRSTHIKTLDYEETMEICVPKAAEKYVKKKKKPIKIKLDIVSQANAGAGAGAGGGPGGTAGGMGSGGVKGKSGGKDCKGAWSSSAKAIAKAENGSTSNADAHAINGGDANAMSLSKDGGNASSAANVKDGGKANAMSLAQNGATVGSEANALDGGMANAVARKNEANQTGVAIANAKRTGEAPPDGCAGGMPDEIEVDSHASANAVNGGNGTGGNTVNSVANTNVKIDMAGLAAKVMEMQSKLGDDDDGPDEISIAINANAGASGSAAGRGFGGFDDPETQSEKMKKASKLGKFLSRAGVQLASGWKTELKRITPNVTLEFEKEIFYGLGNCPFKHQEFPADKNPEAVIDFYIKALRLDCNDKVKPRIMRLFNEGFLNFDDSMNYFVIPFNNQIMKRPKIKDSELRLLSVAFEFTVFSATYHQQMANLVSTDLAPYVAPDVGIPATRSIRFITELALNFVEAAHHIASHHKVRLVRNLLTTLRTVMLKVFQDGVAVKECKACTLDQETNRNDQLHIMGLLQYIIHGNVPYERGLERNLRKAFKSFLILNRKTLESRIKDYEKQATPSGGGGGH